jgi:hypothetical protein
MKIRSVAAVAALVLALPLVVAAQPAGAPAPRQGPDANQDGFLSRAEAQAAADTRFARLDANGDGKLLPDERPERPRGDGYRAGGPMGPEGGPRRGMRHGGPEGGPMRAVLFEEYDANRDGALSKAEFRKHALKTFDARDGNGDGKVKLPERRHMQGEGRHHHGGKRG